ncbi:MAG TPA: dTMP kinase [Candidatus Nanoarchaeia archaeon]|nr:dTMP kinase [Candidatus Nanoarchaeia archaeon]
MKNLFIVLDGMDGAGKGEMIERLHNYLFKKSKKYRILTTREPTYGKHGKEIREMLKQDKDPKSNAKKYLELFTKDRKEHLEKTIIPFLAHDEGHNLVLCDRYYYSTIAFQHTQGLPEKECVDANKNFLKPDIAFILDLPADIAIERVSRRGEKEKFEELEFMRELRKNFLKLKQILGDNIIVIDASKPVEGVFESVRKEVDKLL